MDIWLFHRGPFNLQSTEPKLKVVLTLQRHQSFQGSKRRRGILIVVGFEAVRLHNCILLTFASQIVVLAHRRGRAKVTAHGLDVHQ